MSVFRFTSTWTPGLDAAFGNDASAAARQKAHSVGEEVAELRGQVDRLQMVCEALWTLIQRQTGADEETLAQLIEEIDLRDGKADGRVRSTGSDCARCGRVVSVRTQVCIYCGSWNVPHGVFGAETRVAARKKKSK